MQRAGAQGLALIKNDRLWEGMRGQPLFYRAEESFLELARGGGIPKKWPNQSLALNITLPTAFPVSTPD